MKKQVKTKGRHQHYHTTSYMLEDLIPVINKLQNVSSTVESSPLDLPQIVVVGSQSAGKSSVLESIVGRDFLPRGSGIVTRRPLVLQLIYNGENDEEWGEFFHLKRKRFYDFEEIRREIERVTDEETGQNKGISNKAINLKITSPHVLNLTLVDLPGITKVPVGDQPQDIEILIKNMILQFISNPNAIILAVSAANADIANSDALKLAREVDPEGVRTVGVLTKIDLMDKGTDCMDVLQGGVYNLKLGFVPVLNRSQQDIIDNAPISAAREKEETFFMTSSVYSSIAHRCGIPFLSSKLNKLLMNHIKKCLPELRQSVNSQLADARKRLQGIGDDNLEQSKPALLLQILNKFTSTFVNTIDGTLVDRNATVELYGGARINYIFNDIFGSYIDSIDAHTGLSPEEIQLIISNSGGTKGSLFIPEGSFEQLVKRQITLLQPPALRCIELVFDELRRIVNSIEFDELRRFGKLKERIIEVVFNLLKNSKKPSKRMIKGLISVELAFINTNHPDFIGGGDAITKILQKRASRQAQQTNRPARPSREEEFDRQRRAEQERRRAEQSRRDKEKEKEKEKSGGFFSWLGGKKKDGKPDTTNESPKMEKVPQRVVPKKRDERDENADFQVDLLGLLLKSYFLIVQKNIKDRVPKTIMHFLVNRSKAEMQNELVTNLYKDEIIDELLEENSQIAQERKRIRERVKILTETQKILSELFEVRVGY
eukprot:TRINITY_DN5946_c0_g1_i1.p1 TRINITY_DN5946_c0_g1~~TRINITY_DN5946_c0_g1_i1.p1  ORF type:complete len:715 (+),score=175.37 TRINITY_DN5946_c0_g1_i1:355-2499(+)